MLYSLPEDCTAMSLIRSSSILPLKQRPLEVLNSEPTRNVVDGLEVSPANGFDAVVPDTIVPVFISLTTISNVPEPVPLSVYIAAT